MFNTKKDRRVVEITIEFNITAIGEWLKTGGKFEDIDKIKRYWEDASTQKYVIDMLPIGQSDNAYFHRSKGIISQNIAGSKYVGKKEAGIVRLSWNLWRGCFSLDVQGKVELDSEGNAEMNLILLTPPLSEVIELETVGRLTNPGTIMSDHVQIKVPASFDDENKAKTFMNIWRGSASHANVAYYNGLGRVSFSTLNFEVEY